MFDAFPDNPHIVRADGVTSLAASFEKVLHEGHGHAMSLQRYDIQPEGRPWQVRYWLPKNWPVFDDKGSIVAIVHHVTDVTASVLTRNTGVTGPVQTTPNVSSLDPLQRADKAILEARETMRETREGVMRARAQMDYVVATTRRLLKGS